MRRSGGSEVSSLVAFSFPLEEVVCFFRGRGALPLGVYFSSRMDISVERRGLGPSALLAVERRR